MTLINSSLYKESITSIASEISVDGGRILITGGSGLIGRCVVDVLRQANQSFGKHFTIFAMGRNAEKLSEAFGDNDDVLCLVQDICNPIAVEQLDYIIHTASNADPVSYAKYPVETIMTNVLGSKNVLEYCKYNKTRALFTSSFEVYGKLEQDEYGENDYGIIDLNILRNCYSESKRMSEMLFKSYYDEYVTNCVIVRLPSVYGPTMQMNDSKAHAQFFRNALEGQNIVLKSKGTQKRSYCYVIDAVSGILRVLINGKSGEVYNIANENSTATIAEVAHVIANISQRKVIYDLPTEIESKGFSKPQNCVLKNERIKKLGWQGKYDLTKGIEETINILKGN